MGREGTEGRFAARGLKGERRKGREGTRKRRGGRGCESALRQGGAGEGRKEREGAMGN